MKIFIWKPPKSKYNDILDEIIGGEVLEVIASITHGNNTTIWNHKIVDISLVPLEVD